MLNNMCNTCLKYSEKICKGSFSDIWAGCAMKITVKDLKKYVNYANRNKTEWNNFYNKNSEESLNVQLMKFYQMKVGVI